MGKWVALSVLLIIVLILIANKDAVMNMLEGGTQYREYPESLEYEVTRSVTMTGSNYRLGTMRIPVPDDIITLGGTYIQEIHSSEHMEPSSVQFSETDESQMWGADSNRTRTWWEWTQPNDASGLTIIEKTHHVTSKTVRWTLDETKTGSVSDITSSNDQTVSNLRDKYLGEEWKVDPLDPLIVDTAADIREGTNGNVYNIVKNTYRFLDQEFTYETGVQMEPKDPVDTLQSRKGDCDDQSILMASILRACGIPAWLEIGGLYDRNANGGQGSWGGHAWLKVWIPMLDDNGFFDPDISGTVDIDVVNDEFLFRSCYRYAEWESDGNGDHLQDYYLFVSYYGAAQITVDWDSNIIASEGSERYLTTDGEVAVPGFEAVAAVASLLVVALAFRRRRKDF